jgi:glucose/arabinose dehydrogenase
MGGKMLYLFNPQGTLLTTWIGAGSDALYAPADVTVGPDGAVYIVDYQANRIQKFTATLS